MKKAECPLLSDGEILQGPCVCDIHTKNWDHSIEIMSDKWKKVYSKRVQQMGRKQRFGDSLKSAK